MIAELRGDYAQAEQRYQASLIIAEELGDRAGIANSYHQFGVLRTKQDRPGEGIPYIISALAIHLDLESPDVSTSLFWLGKQRQEVGEESFMQILGGLLDADRVQFVIDELNSIRNGGDPD
ncbi:MAG: tetratricopeptide repeat protein [Pseudonocardiaceae bacterium]